MARLRCETTHSAAPAEGTIVRELSHLADTCCAAAVQFWDRSLNGSGSARPSALVRAVIPWEATVRRSMN